MSRLLQLQLHMGGWFSCRSMYSVMGLAISQPNTAHSRTKEPQKGPLSDHQQALQQTYICSSSGSSCFSHLKCSHITQRLGEEHRLKHQASFAATSGICIIIIIIMLPINMPPLAFA
jgi:hypothetical protein